MSLLAVSTVDLARGAVRDDLDLPLPLRAAHARPRPDRRDLPDRVAPDRQRGLAPPDAVLRDAVPDQLRDRRRHRARAGVPVRDELVGLLALRRQRLRRAARRRGLAAFFLESTFLGLWIFGWNRLSPRLHLATLWIAVAGTWLSAYFILVANSWMQDPVGYKIVNGEAQLTSVWQLVSSDWALYAFVHTTLAGLTAGAAVVLGVCCWHFARGRNVEAVHAGGEGGADRARPGLDHQSRVRQPLRDPRHQAPADEDLGERGAVGRLPAVRLLALPDRGLHGERREAVVLDRDPRAPLLSRHGLVQRQGDRAHRAATGRSRPSTARETTCRRSRSSTGACA